MTALLLVAMSVGLDNFAASTALGVSGVDCKLRIRLAVIFGVFEGVMPVVGLLLGRSLAHDLGSTANCSVIAERSRAQNWHQAPRTHWWGAVH